MVEEKAPGGAPALRAVGLSRNFGKKRVLEKVSLELYPGEMAALTGNNGSGKTTLLKLLAGVLKPREGEILYFGKRIPAGSAALSRLLAYLPQENPLLPELSVQDNLSLFTGKGGRPEEGLIRQFGLEEILKTPVKRLSGGMRRRVAFCASCCLGQPIFLLDEPTSALDLEQKKRIREWMAAYRDRGGALLAATHDEAEIAACDRVIAL